MNKSVVCLSLLRPQYRRAYVKKIRPHNFTAGDSVLLTSDSVLFRNTEEHGLTSTLNVIRVVKEKVGRDLYKVEHGNQGIVLFGSEMVPYTPSSSDSRDSTQSTSTSLLIEPRLVLDKIAMYAKLQRDFFAARRKYSPSMISKLLLKVLVMISLLMILLT